jgi:hypothetical protein
MPGLIPYILLIGIFTVIGVYFIFWTNHFLRWNSLSNKRLHVYIDGMVGRPVLVPRAEANYARLQASGGLLIFKWTIRVIGIILTVFSLLTIARIMICF